jgi:hypothetical protein
MAQKGAHPEERRDAWIARRAEWWAARRLDRSSEDVWELRTCVGSWVCWNGADAGRTGSPWRTTRRRILGALPQSSSNELLPRTDSLPYS